jgi:hypothetical protein
MPPTSLALSLLLWFAVIGAVRDWRYMRRGGVHPTRREKWSLVLAIVLCVTVMFLPVVAGGDPEVLGRLTTYLLVGIFVVWEGWRVFIRAGHPVGTPKVPHEHGRSRDR